MWSPTDLSKHTTHARFGPQTKITRECIAFPPRPLLNQYAFTETHEFFSNITLKNRIFAPKTPFTRLIYTPTYHLSIHESPVEKMWLWDLPVNGNSWRRGRNSFHGMSLAAQEPLLARLSSPHMHSIFFAFILLQRPYIPSFSKEGTIHWPRRRYWTAIGRVYRSPIGLFVFFC